MKDEVIIINSYWLEALKETKFKKSDKNKYLFINNCKKYDQSIRFIPKNKKSNLFKIRLGLGYIDIFKDSSPNAENFVILAGMLHENAVIIDDFEIGEKWWDISNRESVDSFLSAGLKWFEEYSSVERLARFFDNEWLQIKKRRTPTATTPPIHDYYLSLLYYELGSLDKACHHAKKWLDFVTSKIRTPDEPERTLRQIRIMGCPSQV